MGEGVVIHGGSYAKVMSARAANSRDLSVGCLPHVG